MDGFEDRGDLRGGVLDQDPQRRFAGELVVADREQLLGERLPLLIGDLERAEVLPQSLDRRIRAVA